MFNWAGKYRKWALALAVLLGIGLLLWGKLRLRNDVPRSALADPEQAPTAVKQ